MVLIARSSRLDCVMLGPLLSSLEIEPGGLEGEPFPPAGEQRAEMDVLDLAVVILERRPFRTARERWHARGHALSSRLGLTWR